MAADIVLKLVVEVVVPYIQRNWDLISGVGDDAETLLKELKTLNAVLADAVKSRTKPKTALWKNFVSNVQKTVSEAEGLIDQLLAQQKLHDDKNVLERTIDAKYTLSVKEIAKKIKSILEDVADIQKKHPEAFRIDQNISDDDDSKRGATSLLPAPNPQDELVKKTEVVGFDDEAKKVMGLLLNDNIKDLDVISVVGLAGLGKSTLALKIFNDPNITYEFYFKIWVYVGQNRNDQNSRKDLCRRILKELKKQPTTTEYDQLGETKLSDLIKETISQGGKCLIVMDDVWSADIVELVMDVFPENEKGHRILLTTRNMRIGRYANSEPHRLKYLTDKESFQLLQLRVFPSRRRKCPDGLAKIGEDIAKRCGGVPLAVVVIAGSLRGKTTEDEWKEVLNNVGEHLIAGENLSTKLSKYVEVSYDNLSEQMKACFLYSGIFPQGHEIPAWKMIRLWISEGLIMSKNDRPEDAARVCLIELVNRSLLIAVKTKADGHIKACRLHDMLYHFCKSEAEEGSFFKHIYQNANDSEIDIDGIDTCRRWCMQRSILKQFISKKPRVEQLRTFLCFSAKEEMKEQLDNRDLFKAFPLVRILDVESFNTIFTKGFRELYHLRYIAISGEFEALPPFFNNFWSMQTLILKTNKPSVNIRANIWKMQRLRHLHTNAPAILPPVEAAQATDEPPSSLQTLSKIAPESCTADVFAKASKLRKVFIQGKLANLLETKLGNFKKLPCLEHLKLMNANASAILKLPPSFYEVLRNLRNLTLSNTMFAWSDANALGRLELLEVLKLKENAFCGQTWGSNGFSNLKVLMIKRATDLENWNASKGSFPILERLVVSTCEKLVAVPSEFANLRQLKEVSLENSKKANNSAKAMFPKGSQVKLTLFPPETAESNPTQ